MPTVYCIFLKKLVTVELFVLADNLAGVFTNWRSVNRRTWPSPRDHISCNQSKSDPVIKRRGLCSRWSLLEAACGNNIRPSCEVG